MSVVLLRTPADRDGWLSLMLFPDAHNSGLLNSLCFGQSACGEFGDPKDVLSLVKSYRLHINKSLEKSYRPLD